MPGLAKEEEEQVIDEVDPELRPEEQGYVRHFLAYADVLLRNPIEDDELLGGDGNTPDSAIATADRDNVTEMPHPNGTGPKDHAA